MNVQDLAANFAAFMTKHSGELRLVAGTLQTVADHLPIDPADKARISEGLASLQTAAGNIATGAQALSNATVEVVVAKEDVVSAVEQVVHNAEAGLGLGQPGNAPTPGGTPPHA